MCLLIVIAVTEIHKAERRRNGQLLERKPLLRTWKSLKIEENTDSFYNNYSIVYLCDSSTRCRR